MFRYTLVICGCMLAPAAYSQQPPQPVPAPVQDTKPVTQPIPGVDTATLAGAGRTSKIVGSTIYKDDTSIGTISDVLVDLNTGTIKAVILSVGGFLGMGDKLVAVPSNQIKISQEAKFTTDLTKDDLTHAPDYHFGK